MTILKCKICGGDMEISSDKTFGTCEYCGSSMTLPKIDDEQKVAAFNRGNHFRRIGEFDKALQVYERIVAEDETDAEAHWCCALCRFGIEWVEDPATLEYLPTCHRASFDIFTDDVDYLAALEHSEGLTQKQYKKDGSKIAEVQRGILATSQNEEPFDVFICYKETGEDGQRTVDSTLAQDIYYQLTDQGLRVFFARITLEDKGGSEYEPYIFAALNSAKVMVAVGTKPEHFNAVWVKNEWSRFLSLMKHDRNRIILPCYKGMDPYDLPEQLSVLQSYDMTKIGFVQDLIRGIKKVTAAEEQTVIKETVVNGASNIEPLLKRVFIFLEDENWKDADTYCEKVLDIDPENAQAYIGKLCCSIKCKSFDDLKNADEPFDNNEYYKKCIRYGNNDICSKLNAFIDYIKQRNEENRLNAIYDNAKSMMDSAHSENSFLLAGEEFEKIKEWKDSKVLYDECIKKAEEARKDMMYYDAVKLMHSKDKHKILDAIPIFESIPGWRDADELVKQCPALSEDAKKHHTYVVAMDDLKNRSKKSIERAIEEFASISGYEDADEQCEKCKEILEKIIENENELEAKRIADEKRVVADKKRAIRKARAKKGLTVTAWISVILVIAYLLTNHFYLEPLEKYNKATKLMKAGKQAEAYDIYESISSFYRFFNINFKDTKAKAFECLYYKQVPAIKDAKVGDVIKFGKSDYYDSNDWREIDWIVLEKKDNKLLLFCKGCVDGSIYSDNEKSTWETSSIRSYLNDDFIQKHLMPQHQNLIVSTFLPTDKNPEYNTNPGNATEDKIFILSLSELLKYYPKSNSKERTEGCGSFWLRTPGDYSGKFLFVNAEDDGLVNYYGKDCDESSGVRPAMWIDLSKIQ